MRLMKVHFVSPKIGTLARLVECLRTLERFLEEPGFYRRLLP